jgi:hypothetical protein
MKSKRSVRSQNPSAFRAFLRELNRPGAAKRDGLEKFPQIRLNTASNSALS